MSYRTAACRCPSASGLGTALPMGSPMGSESPGVLASRITRLTLGFQSTLRKVPSGHVSLANEAMRIQNWFTEANRDMGARDFRNALIKVNTLERMVPDFARKVAEAITSGTKSLEEAEAGGSLLCQLAATLGIPCPTPIYRPESETADKWALGGWLVALAAGALGVTVLLSIVRR